MRFKCRLLALMCGYLNPYPVNHEGITALLPKVIGQIVVIYMVTLCTGCKSFTSNDGLKSGHRNQCSLVMLRQACMNDDTFFFHILLFPPLCYRLIVVSSFELTCSTTFFNAQIAHCFLSKL